MASDTSTHPWWTRQLDEVTRRSEAYLRRHFPGVANAHEDIASEVKTQLAEQIARAQGEYPESWYGIGPDESSSEHDYYFQLAQTILRRRIADHFREKSLAWARDVEIESVPEESLGTSDSSNERRVALERMLKFCVEFIAKLPAEEQVLVSRLADGESSDGMPLTPSERQRLHRIRKRLGAEMEARLGESVRSMLRDD